jgi:hypothetical protein
MARSKTTTLSLEKNDCFLIFMGAVSRFLLQSFFSKKDFLGNRGWKVHR